MQTKRSKRRPRNSGFSPRFTSIQRMKGAPGGRRQASKRRAGTLCKRGPRQGGARRRCRRQRQERASLHVSWPFRRPIQTGQSADRAPTRLCRILRFSENGRAGQIVIGYDGGATPVRAAYPAGRSQRATATLSCGGPKPAAFSRTAIRKSADRVRSHTRDGQAQEGLVCRLHRASHVDAAAGVLHHDHLEAAAVRVLGRVAHAEVEREAGDEYALQATLAQVAGEPCRRRVVVLVEGRIGIDVRR